MKKQLLPRQDTENPRKRSNFIGIVKGLHVFVGNFTYVTDFVIVEDISSAIYPCLSHVLLRKPFVEVSRMTYDLNLGIVRFTEETDELAYQMPYKIEQFRLMPNLRKELKQVVYYRNDEDKRRGVDYVMNKILGFYKEFLQLGPKYKTKIEDDLENVTGYDVT
jgi:hypothetical protein